MFQQCRCGSTSFNTGGSCAACGENDSHFGKTVIVDDPRNFTPPTLHEQIIPCPICKGLRGDTGGTATFSSEWMDCTKCNGTGLLRLRVKYDDIPVVGKKTT